MLEVRLDEDKGIATLVPRDELTEADFEYAARRIDDYLEQAGRLQGMIIQTRDFPGWESFSAMRTHFRFVRDHHRQIDRVALVTDSAVGELGDRIADHFVSAEIRHFAFDDFKDAEKWVEAA